MPSSEQRIHGWILMGMLSAVLAGIVSSLLWAVLGLSGDAMGAAVARIFAFVSAGLLTLCVVGQALLLSYLQVRGSFRSGASPQANSPQRVAL